MQRKSRINYLGLPIFVGIVASGLVSAFSSPVKAADIYGNGDIKFDTDTIVEFEFLESNGAYQSTFGVVDLDTGEKTPLMREIKPSDVPQDVTRPSDYVEYSANDFKGTPGNSVPNPLPEFEFKANRRYAFYLESTYNGRSAGILYSTDAMNPGSNQQTRFEGGSEALLNGGSVIRWDDTGSVLVRSDREDRDFDDFVVRVGGHEACPYSNGNSRQKLAQGGVYELAMGTQCTGK
ncbi:MAG TPA: hypothetical protein V6C95_01880 [Coleofasciculaceae cyanobacterium]